MSKIGEGMTVNEMIKELTLIKNAGFGNKVVSVYGENKDVKIVNLTSDNQPYISI